MQRKLALAALAVSSLAAACGPRAREYELRGVVVAVDSARQEITIKHEDIPRFMPGMTMPFKVRDGKLLLGRVPGDLVRATLVVEDSDAHLRGIERTGSVPVPEVAAPTRMDLLDTGAEVPDLTFLDQHGEGRRLSEWRGQALAVTFIYTRCPLPNFCPLMDRHFTAAQQTIHGDPALKGRVRLLSVSFDPAYDRPSVLAGRARELGADPAVWLFATGERAEIEQFAARFGVSVVQEHAKAEEIVHNLRTAIVAPDGRLSAILRGNEWTPQDLIRELRNAVAPAGR